MLKSAVSLMAIAAVGLSSVAYAQGPSEPKPPLKAEEASVPIDKPGATNDWWPRTLDLTALRQHETQANPYGADFDYAKEFATLDIEAVKADIRKVLTTSQPWWPADYGHYGPFFIRMAWHGAGTYRTWDGRGGADGGEQRFEPLNSWPDNVSLDKARRLVWPIKQKYGRKLSWGDLMVLTGNVSMEDMGFKTLGFAGGRVDAWQPDVVFWGPEAKMLGDQRRDGKGNLKGPLAATQMGLIYVNPEGPNGNPDPLAAAADIRRAFSAMAMDDEETAALIAGGHTFGKAHGAHKVEECVAGDPGVSSIEQQGLGWANKCGKGHSEDTITSGLEGAWSANPIAFTTQFLDNLYGFEWEKHKSPAGGWQWRPTDASAASLVPDAHVKGKTHAPMMFTTDIALREDPGFRKITTRWREDPQEFANAFARAWFKLTHRDLGGQARYLGNDAPSQSFLWQDPLPQADYAMIDAGDVAQLKSQLLGAGLSTSEMVRAAWASASTWRQTDMRGGANGARLSLDPQRNWAVNDPAELKKVLAAYTRIQNGFNKGRSDGKKVSLADLIVLGGNAAVEQAAQRAGRKVTVPFTAGRVDATQAQTDVTSFSYLEPKADGFRNYYNPAKADFGPAESLVDKADLLGLTVPEMAVLVGGMRALDANSGKARHGVLTDRPGTLSNDFFVNLLSMDTAWSKSNRGPGLYEGKDRKTGAVKWTATPVDLVFGSNSELRAVAEVYASDDADQMFTDHFVRAWAKVMDGDRL
ncbi:catalase/peroxidase HPI [Novosphingobium sp. M1R2S20]|uniref:Catalase-peroxidase n=1 Tax=Novosphingobium rhizovicinum TaxID=3228928 RepID=A0ABV3REB0_9SPHN